MNPEELDDLACRAFLAAMLLSAIRGRDRYFLASEFAMWVCDWLGVDYDALQGLCKRDRRLGTDYLLKTQMKTQ